jgi:hypothetical protein
MWGYKYILGLFLADEIPTNSYIVNRFVYFVEYCLHCKSDIGWVNGFSASDMRGIFSPIQILFINNNYIRINRECRETLTCQ